MDLARLATNTFSSTRVVVNGIVHDVDGDTVLGPSCSASSDSVRLAFQEVAVGANENYSAPWRQPTSQPDYGSIVSSTATSQPSCGSNISSTRAVNGDVEGEDSADEISLEARDEVESGTPTSGTSRAPKRMNKRKAKGMSENKAGSKCYPFPCDLRLKVGGGSVIKVAKHLSCAEDVKAIIVFAPGVHGGVGPCRGDGQPFDDEALFPMLARGFESQPIDCYRISWPCCGFLIDQAVASIGRVLIHAMAGARGRPEGGQHRIILVGHSFGGAAVLVAASAVVISGADMAGVVALAPAHCGGQIVELEGVPKLLYHGNEDEIIPPGQSQRLYNAMAMPKSMHLLKNCAHDFLACKDLLHAEIRGFIVENALRS